MGLFPVLPRKITVNSSKCFSLPFSITCALPISALLLTSLWADFMQTSTHLSCEDETLRRGRDGKAVCHLWVHGIKLLLSYQVPLVAACKWIRAVKNSCSLLNLASVGRWMCIFLLLLFSSASLKTRFENSLCFVICLEWDCHQQ